jgi:hypothetical protein
LATVAFKSTRSASAWPPAAAMPTGVGLPHPPRPWSHPPCGIANSPSTGALERASNLALACATAVAAFALPLRDASHRGAYTRFWEMLFISTFEFASAWMACARSPARDIIQQPLKPVCPDDVGSWQKDRYHNALPERRRLAGMLAWYLCLPLCEAGSLCRGSALDPLRWSVPRTAAAR